MTLPVYPIKLNEVHTAAKTLSQAFETDPLMHWLFADDTKYQNLATDLFATWVNYGIRYGMALRTENFESVAIRRRPGDTTFSLWRLLRSGMLKTPRLIGQEGMKKLEKLEHAAVEIRKKTMQQQSFWYCWMLGTLPQKQHHGFGQTLMQATFAKAATDNLPCYLEALTDSKAQAVHERAGYQPLTTFAVPESELRLTAMLRHG